MGTWFSYMESEEERINRDIEEALRDEMITREDKREALILGPTGAGKSTLVKQFRIIHGTSFSDEEIEIARQHIFRLLLSGMVTILDELSEVSKAATSDTERDALRKVPPNSEQFAPLSTQQLWLREELVPIPDLSEGEAFPLKYQNILKEAWEDPSIKRFLKEVNSTTVPENLQYLFNSINRLFSPGYVPSTRDILCFGSHTTGILPTVVEMQPVNLHLIEVGGQKGEHRQWIHCFEHVTTIWFLAALSDYNQYLSDDGEETILAKAMTLWGYICHSPWFLSTPFMLFLTKKDVFDAKLSEYPLKDYFPEYKGSDTDPMEAANYIKSVFLAKAERNQAKNPDEDEEFRILHCHFVNTTDTQQMRDIFGTTEDLVAKENLTNVTLL